MWSAVRVIPNDYNDEIQAIDEQIMELIQQRKTLAAGRRMFPGVTLQEEWAGRYGMETEQITFAFSGIAGALPKRRFREEPGPLQGVLPIMKAVTQSDVEYVISHAMQHQEFSVVTVQIAYLKETAEEVSLRPALDLAVEGGQVYEVQRYGGHGGGARTQMQFAVSPPLTADGLGELRFSLLPGSDALWPRFTEILLNQQVDFD